MSNDISSIQNQILYATQVHHGGGGHGHGKKINQMQVAVSDDEKETRIKPKTLFKSAMTAKININPDADSKQQKKQQKENSPEGSGRDEETEEKPFSLDVLELIGQLNMATIYTRAGIKNSSET